MSWPWVAGALIAGMVHIERLAARSGGGGAIGAAARDVNPTWWPFVALSAGFLALAAFARRLPTSLDTPRS